MTVLISELSEAMLSRISKFVNRFCTDFKTSIGVKNMYEIYCKLRDAKGCKDSDVAKNTGITKSTFSDWKSGRSNPKNDKLQKIADYFDVSINYLTGNSFIEDMGRIIQEERTRQKMTQEEIATAANISVAELDEYESLGLPIREDIFNDIADALDTSYLQLLYDYDLYDDIIPPRYNGDVAKWEADKQAAEWEAMGADLHANIARNDSERRLLMLCRRAGDASEEEKKALIDQFESTIDIYLRAKGIKKG